MCYRKCCISTYLIMHLILVHFSELSHGAVLVTRPGGSREDCERLCREEAEIECRYYKYNSVKRECTLTSDPDATITGLRKLREKRRRTDESWISRLQARVLALEQKDLSAKDLRKDMSELRAEIESLKNGRALTHHLLRTNKEQTDQNIGAVDDKVEYVKSEIKRVEDAMMSIGDLQKTVGKKIRQLTEEIKTSGLTVTMLSQSSKDTRASLREIGNTISDMRSSVSDLKKSVTDLQVRFAGLSSDVMDKVGSVDSMVGPELKEIKLSQTTLAQALALLTKKIMAVSHRIPDLQKQVSSKEGKLIVIDAQLKGLGKQISFQNERLSFTEGQLKLVIDPSSRMNVERRNFMTRLRGQVESLQTSQTRMQNDLLLEITDRSQIYKEISTIKVHNKGVVDQVANLQTSMQHFRRSVRKLLIEGPKGRLVTNILSRQVAILKSLKSLRNTQVEIHDAVRDFRVRIQQTRNEMLKRDQQRRVTEHEIRGLQGKLIKVFRKIRWTLVHNAKNKLMKSLIDQQNQAFHEMKKMKQLQKVMTRELVKYRKTSAKAKKILLLQLKEQHFKYKKILRALLKKMKKFHKILTSKKLKAKALVDRAALKKLGDLKRTQSAILDSLSGYGSYLKKTSAELTKQRIRQFLSAQKTIALQKQIKRLNITLVPLTNVTVQLKKLSQKKKRRIIMKNLVKLAKTQFLLFKSFAKYRTALKKIRKVLVAQRKRQSINSRNSLLLHLQMKKLNQTIVPLANITQRHGTILANITKVIRINYKPKVKPKVKPKIKKQKHLMEKKIARLYSIIKKLSAAKKRQEAMLANMHKVVKENLEQKEKMRSLKERQASMLAAVRKAIRDGIRHKEKMSALQNTHLTEINHRMKNLAKLKLQNDRLKSEIELRQNMMDYLREHKRLNDLGRAMGSMPGHKLLHTAQ